MYEKELDIAIKAAKNAAKVVLKFYKSNKYQVELKNDQSPVTSADKLSDKLIRDFLLSEFPCYSILSEETIDDKKRINNEYIWIVDPIDGTKEFIAGIDDFTINIALCHYHEIVLGVILVPAKNELYYAIKGCGAYYVDINNTTSKISCHKKNNDFVYVTSNFHTTPKEKALIEINKAKIMKIIKAGAAYKSCLIARGIADISFRITENTKEWDTAVCSIILQEAGGVVLDLNFKPILYNRDDIVNHGGYILLNNIENLSCLIFNNKDN